MPRKTLPLLSALLGAGILCAPTVANAQVQRCETADGRTIYTDRPCGDVDAVERLQRGEAPGRIGAPRQSCPRTVQALAFGLTFAIDARDPNALAALYHWPGIGTRAGYEIMDRLDAISQRPLVDVRPLYPDEGAQPDAATGTAAPALETPLPPAADTGRDPSRPPTASELMHRTSPWRPSSVARADPGASDSPPAISPSTSPPAGIAPRPPRVPHALQVEQTLAGSGTPSRTVFGLRRHLGCWWLSL